jgi:acetyl esterase/lipase
MADSRWRWLAQFPATLLVTGTRDFLASPVIYAHSQLVKAGVDAELHFWEGMDRCFSFYVDLSKSKEMFEVTAKFFNAHLGKSRRLSRAPDSTRKRPAAHAGPGHNAE